MKKNSFYRGMLFVILLGAILAGCGSGGGGSKGPSNGVLSSLTYGGADAKGDYIAITIDASASTLTIQNYTLGGTKGPYRFSKVTDPAQNGGFQNLYRTVPFSDNPNHYAQFIIANGAAILYQVFDDKGPVGTPCFAFYRKDVPNLNVYNGTAYNWVRFQMDLDEKEGNFEVGLVAFDDDGTWYGAGYDNRMWVDYPNNPEYKFGVHKSFGGRIIKTSDFSHEPSIVAHQFENVTAIATHNNDFIFDAGLNNGAFYAIRQATTNSWQSMYNGTYFLLCYENNNNGSEQSITSMKLVLSGSNFQISQGGTLMISGRLYDVETCPGGPEGNPLASLFEEQSGCSSATSNNVKNAYNCRGSFMGSADAGSDASSAIYLIMDPKGQYLCVTIFKENNDNTYNYWFGFGIKG